MFEDEDDGWIPLHKFDFDNPDLQHIHIDTRDFCVSGVKTAPKEYKPSESLQQNVTIEQIKEAVFKWKEQSGGEREWRHFDLLNTKHSGSWEFKYLRFYRSSVGWNFGARARGISKNETIYPIEYITKDACDFVDQYLSNKDEKVSSRQIAKLGATEVMPEIPDHFTVYNTSDVELQKRMYESGKRGYSHVKQVVRSSPKIGNNEKCPCGSGLKFKKCCK
jgi:hypothetical protein